MAEIVSSAVAEGIVTQIVSSVLDMQRQERRPSEEERLERLEMAHIKLEAALETSDKWRISDASLLRWRCKLKRAARECDDALRRCKRRAVEDVERRRAARGASFPARLAHAARSFLSSGSGILGGGGGGGGDDDGRGWSGPAVRRFEWYADGAAEFLRFVELGGTPRRYAFFDPLIARLLAGDELRYRLVRGSQYHLFCVRPISLEGRGVEAKLIFISEDSDAPEKNLCISSMLRLSESTDIVGTTIKCLQLLVTPHFRSTAEAAARELASLPTQDFSWVPYADSTHKEHWNSIHRDMSQCFRPDPLCCHNHQHRAEPPCEGDTGAMGLPEVSLESVIEVYWQCQIPLSEDNTQRRRAIAEGRAASSRDAPHLKLGLLFTPHGSLGRKIKVAAVDHSAAYTDAPIVVAAGCFRDERNLDFPIHLLTYTAVFKISIHEHKIPPGTAFSCIFWIPPRHSEGV